MVIITGQPSKQSSAPSSTRDQGGVASVEGVGLVGRGQHPTRGSGAGTGAAVKLRGKKMVKPASNSLERDELLALDVLGKQALAGEDREELTHRQREGREEGVVRPDTEYGMESRHENSYLEESVGEGEGEGEGGGERGGEEEGGGQEGDGLFSYFSPPRSAGSRHTLSVRDPITYPRAN